MVVSKEFIRFAPRDLLCQVIAILCPFWAELHNTLVPVRRELACFILTPPYFYVTIMENIFEEQVKSELKSMDQRLYDMEEKINSIDTKLTQVIDAILGNPLTKQGGFVKDIEFLEEKIADLEKKVEKQEDFKKKVYWVAAVIGTLVIGAEYITKIFANLTN